MARKRVDSVKELKNVYYIYGDEELLVEEALKRLKSLLSSEVDADFNLEVLNAKEVGAERIIDSAETIPLMSDRRLIIARDVNQLGKKEQDALAEYVERPNPATTLVLVAHIPGPGEPSDANVIKRVESSALFKKAQAVGETLKFTIGRGRQQKVEEWVTEQFKKNGRRIESDARDQLIEKVGRDLRSLSDAIERICLFAADSEVISAQQVALVVVPAAEQGIFELVDSVADRRRDVSLYVLNRLLRQGESPQRIFNMLLRQFRLMARCKSLAVDHEYGAIASELKIPAFLVGKCIKQSRRFSSERLRAAFLEFKKAQIEMHSGSYLPQADYQAHMLEMLIVKIVG